MGELILTDHSGPIAIDSVRLIDGTGAPPVEDATVVIEGDRIVASGPRGQVAVPAEATIIPGIGRTVLPGLIDVHVHDPSDANMELYVRNGVTSIRFAGGQQRYLLGLRHRIDTGEIPGPRVFSVGSGVDGTPHAWPGSNAADSPIEARRLIRRLVHQDQVDAILATHRVKRPVLAAIVETAHELGIPVTGQTWVTDADDAIAAGMDGLENTARIPTSSAFPAERLFGYTSVSHRLALLAHLWVAADRSELAELAQRLAESGLALAPELVSFEGWAGVSLDEVINDRDCPADPQNPLVVGYQRHNGFITKDWDANDFAAQVEALGRYREFCGQYHRAGGLLIAGTDMGLGGILLHRELEHFQRAGLTPLQAIRTATRQAASALGRDDLGWITPGVLADVVVVEGDPTKDLRTLRNVQYVFRGGQPIVKPEHSSQPLEVGS